MRRVRLLLMSLLVLLPWAVAGGAPSTGGGAAWAIGSHPAPALPVLSDATPGTPALRSGRGNRSSGGPDAGGMDLVAVATPTRVGDPSFACGVGSGLAAVPNRICETRCTRGPPRA